MQKLSAGHAMYGAMSWVAGLSYCGVRGGRLPSAFDLDGSRPCIGDDCTFPAGEFADATPVLQDRLRTPLLGSITGSGWSVDSLTRFIAI